MRLDHREHIVSGLTPNDHVLASEQARLTPALFLSAHSGQATCLPSTPPADAVVAQWPSGLAPDAFLATVIPPLPRYYLHFILCNRPIAYGIMAFPPMVLRKQGYFHVMARQGKAKAWLLLLLPATWPHLFLSPVPATTYYSETTTTTNIRSSTGTTHFNHPLGARLKSTHPLPWS
jgi:hypothetical protein